MIRLSRYVGGSLVVILAGMACCLCWSCSGTGDSRTSSRSELKPFTTADGAETVPEQARHARALSAWAAAFRLHAAADFPKAVKEFGAESAFERITRSASCAKAPHVWSYFFCTSAPVLTMPAPRTAYAAYYNPYVEAAIITLWSLDDADHPRIVKATLRSNGELRGGRLAESNYAPTWLMSDRSPQEMLARQYQQFLQDSAQLLSADPKTGWESLAAISPDTLDAVGLLAAALLADLDGIQNGPDKVLAQAMRKLTAAVRDGDEAALKAVLPADGPLPAADIAKLPAAFREKVVPVAAVPLKDCALVFLGNPDQGWTYLTVAVETIAPYRMGPLGVFDLNWAKRPATTQPQPGLARQEARS